MAHRGRVRRVGGVDPDVATRGGLGGRLGAPRVRLQGRTARVLDGFGARARCPRAGAATSPATDPRKLAEAVLAEMLPLDDQRRVEMAVNWPSSPRVRRTRAAARGARCATRRRRRMFGGAADPAPHHLIGAYVDLAYETDRLHTLIDGLALHGLTVCRESLRPKAVLDRTSRTPGALEPRLSPRRRPARPPREIPCASSSSCSSALSSSSAHVIGAASAIDSCSEAIRSSSFASWLSMRAISLPARRSRADADSPRDGAGGAVPARLRRPVGEVLLDAAGQQIATAAAGQRIRDVADPLQEVPVVA